MTTPHPAVAAAVQRAREIYARGIRLNLTDNECEAMIEALGPISEVLRAAEAIGREFKPHVYGVELTRGERRTDRFLKALDALKEQPHE